MPDSSSDRNKEVSMTVRRSKRFQRTLNTLATMLAISRDEVIERAVRAYYHEQVDFIEAQDSEKDPEATLEVA